jgi:cytochrome P450
MARRMKAPATNPDPMPPGVRALLYGSFCWLNRHVEVLRRIGWVLRLWPFIGGWFGFAARASAVKRVLMRPRSFSNRAHAPNLVSGDYLIGMDPGPVYDADRALLNARLAALKKHFDSDSEAQRRVQSLQSLGPKSFDLIEDYLLWVVFRAIEPVFGAAASRVAVGAEGDVTDEGLQRQYLLDTRYVAGQLLAGSLSTLPFQRRAELCADSLRKRINGVSSDIQRAWGVPNDPEFIERNAVGLAWISHPVTVQSGALVVQELLIRSDAYRSLRERTAKIGEAGVWSNADFRRCVRDHVLELMRFRPIFPLLARNVPRDTQFETGGRHNAPCRGGSSVAIWSIAALFDKGAVPDSGKFCPQRDWRHEEPLRYLMFGYGDRQCPAKDFAVDIITSALIGLLILPELQLAPGDGKPIAYDGPLMSRMRVRFAQQGK